MKINEDFNIILPDKNATVHDFKSWDKVWFFQFGDVERVYPAIVKLIENDHILVFKYALGLWVERVALPCHLSKRDYDISFDILQRRKTLWLS